MSGRGSWKMSGIIIHNGKLHVLHRLIRRLETVAAMLLVVVSARKFTTTTAIARHAVAAAAATARATHLLF